MPPKHYRNGPHMIRPQCRRRLQLEPIVDPIEPHGRKASSGHRTRQYGGLARSCNLLKMRAAHALVRPLPQGARLWQSVVRRKPERVGGGKHDDGARGRRCDLRHVTSGEHVRDGMGSRGDARDFEAMRVSASRAKLDHRWVKLGAGARGFERDGRGFRNREANVVAATLILGGPNWHFPPLHQRRVRRDADGLERLAIGRRGGATNEAVRRWCSAGARSARGATDRALVRVDGAIRALCAIRARLAGRALARVRKRVEILDTDGSERRGAQLLAQIGLIVDGVKALESSVVPWVAIKARAARVWRARVRGHDDKAALCPSSRKVEQEDCGKEPHQCHSTRARMANRHAAVESAGPGDVLPSDCREGGEICISIEWRLRGIRVRGWRFITLARAAAFSLCPLMAAGKLFPRATDGAGPT